MTESREERLKAIEGKTKGYVCLVPSNAAKENFVVCHEFSKKLCDCSVQWLLTSLRAAWAREAVMREALEFYAGKNRGAEWVSHACDSHSGLVAAFDWDGDYQDEPDQIAREALEKVGSPAPQDGAEGDA